jgi:pyocin large subunit-like protein
MSTKGPSNRYGNTRGGKNGHKTEKTGFAWAKGFNKTSLDKHFDEHGKGMGFQSKEEYAAHAITFANTVDRVNNDSLIDGKGTTYKWSKTTHELALITSKGIVISYYKTDGFNYYNKKGGKIWKSI